MPSGYPTIPFLKQCYNCGNNIVFSIWTEKDLNIKIYDKKNKSKLNMYSQIEPEQI
jgi:hypothetical protein